MKLSLVLLVASAAAAAAFEYKDVCVTCQGDVMHKLVHGDATLDNVCEPNDGRCEFIVAKLGRYRGSADTFFSPELSCLAPLPNGLVSRGLKHCPFTARCAMADLCPAETAFTTNLAEAVIVPGTSPIGRDAPRSPKAESCEACVGAMTRLVHWEGRLLLSEACPADHLGSAQLAACRKAAEEGTLLAKAIDKKLDCRQNAHAREATESPDKLCPMHARCALLPSKFCPAPKGFHTDIDRATTDPAGEPEDVPTGTPARASAVTDEFKCTECKAVLGLVMFSYSKDDVKTPESACVELLKLDQHQVTPETFKQREFCEGLIRSLREHGDLERITKVTFGCNNKEFVASSRSLNRPRPDAYCPLSARCAFASLGYCKVDPHFHASLADIDNPPSVFKK